MDQFDQKKCWRDSYHGIPPSLATSFFIERFRFVCPQGQAEKLLQARFPKSGRLIFPFGP
jgi:hypothetical protein